MVLSQPCKLQDIEKRVLKEYNKVGGFGQAVENFSESNKRFYLKGDSIDIPNSDATIRDDLDAAVSMVNANLDALIPKRLHRMSIEMNVPLARRRTLNEESAFMQSDENEYSPSISSSLIQNDIFPSKCWSNEVPKTCLYDDLDLLESIKLVKVRKRSQEDKNMTTPFYESFWSGISVPCNAMTIEEMQFEYRELHPMFKHFGFDDGLDGAELFVSDRISMGEKVLAKASARSARQFCKQGVPANLRAKLWDLMIQSEITESYAIQVKRVYTHLKVLVSRYDLLVDRLVQLDSKHAGNDDGYFVFEDNIREMLLLWTRDTSFQKCSPSLNGRPVDDSLGNAIEEWCLDSEFYPPNNIFPFWGISLYTMPVCYLHSDLAYAYMTFRELYSRYFYRLHTLSSKKGGILHLCITFEKLLKQTDPILFYHMTNILAVQPLDIAFKWMLYGFVGVLDCEQVLLMWDRIIAYDSLELLPLTAVALFSYRRDLIVQSFSAKEIHASLSELSIVKWVPIVQNLLFGSKN